MTAERVAGAVRVAREVAVRHGVRVDDVRVLHDGANVVVRLLPAPVVARVATLTTALRPDPARHFGREVSLAAALARAGAAVVPPSDLLPPGPHAHAGTVVSFWTAVNVRPGAPTAEQAGVALAELHDHLAGLPADGTPLDTPQDDVAAFTACGGGWGVPAPLLARLGERLAALRPELVGGTRRLHGDPHPGNLLAAPTGWVWGDFEDSCAGPPEWDLACLRSTRRLDGRAALDAIGAPSDDELRPWLELRRLHAAVWGVVIDARHPASAADAHARLRAVLEG
ncbi:phosphotransferase [Geodermatophilus sp. SYSU D00815]